MIQGPADTVPRITEGYASFIISDVVIEFDKETLNHPVLVPMLTSVFKSQIRQSIEKQVENNLTGFIGKLGEMMTNALSQANRPILTGIELAKKAVKSTQLAQVYEKRREMLE